MTYLQKDGGEGVHSEVKGGTSRAVCSACGPYNAVRTLNCGFGCFFSEHCDRAAPESIQQRSDLHLRRRHPHRRQPVPYDGDVHASGQWNLQPRLDRVAVIFSFGPKLPLDL